MSIFKKKRKKRIQASFYFRDKKQFKEWKQYLIEIEESQRDTIWDLIDGAIEDAKAMDEYLTKASEYEKERMK